MQRKTLTTFQAAKICGVFATTIIQWVNKGKLPAYKTPGGHRRIFVADLLEFLRKYEMPIPDDLDVKFANKAKILIVDDDPRIARMLEKVFSKPPHAIETRAVHGGIEALVMIGEWMPDLVILDAVMPIVDGPKVCASLKSDAKTKDIKIIAITGKRLPDPTKRFLTKNTDAFFSKPFDIMKMYETAMKLLRAKTPKISV